MNFKNFLYVITGMSFCVIIGAAVYEHIAVWPRAYAAPPASLTMLQGPYGLDAASFWMVIHPINLSMLILCLIIFWKTTRRKNILTILIGYILVLALTFIYFVPELIAITSTPFTQTVDPSLIERGETWVVLSIIRLCFLVGLAAVFLTGLMKPVAQAQTITNPITATPAIA